MHTRRHTALSALVAAVLVAALVPVQPGFAALPPLIDREIFFGDPEIAGAQISPDGQWISFRKPYREVMNIWVKRIGEPFDAARPITADTERPIRGYFWTQDSRYVLYVQDKGGNENFHVYAVDPDGEPAGETGVPESRDLTPLDDVRAAIYAVPERTPGHIIVGLNDRDPALHDVYRLSIDTGERTLLIKNDTNVAQWTADLDGIVRLAWRQTADGGSEILRVEGGKLGEVIYSCNYEESCFPYRFHKDGDRVYILSNRGEEIDLAQLMLMDPTDGSTTLVQRDPMGEVDFGGAIFSDKTEELIGTVYVGDRQRIYPAKAEFEELLDNLRAQLPDGELSLLSQSEDDEHWIVAVSQDVNPGQVYFYDRQRNRAEKLYDARPELPSRHLAPMQPLRYTSRDGTEIPGYLTTPRGVAPSKLPTVVLPHGGPWSRDVWGYDSFTQFLANRGYAVFQPNFRGSTGYGKAFLNAGNKEWGTGLMQHDITDAVRHLVDQGIADPDRVAIMGGSYGGYATLAGVAFTPDLYAAGVSIVGPSNIITLLDSIPPYWGPIKKMFHKRVGDPDDPEDRERLVAQSPFYHASEITAPLLVIQGANDPRVKKAESDQIVVALRDLERDVEYIVAPDEGHGFAGEVNRLAMFAVIEEFLAGHLGGRYQTGATPEVSERISALRVDVSAVEMPKAPEGSADAARAELPAADGALLAESETRYNGKLSMAGMEIDFEVTRTLTRGEIEGRPVWRLSTLSNSPMMGEQSDVFELDAETLRPLRRAFAQGPISLDLAYDDAGVKGAFRAQGQEMPVEVTLEAPVLAGNPGDPVLEVVLSALPLAEGYATSIRTFNVQTQQVRRWQLEVAERKRVEVAAGAYECFGVKLTALDGEGGESTFWLTADTPRVTVRSEILLPPAMRGGQLVMELISRQ